jgi:type II secretory pathway pseudopilin PulG
MNRRPAQASTLIEALVAMGVMTVFLAVAVSTSQRSMTLQKRMESQADGVIDACRLAERVRLDCRDATRVTRVDAQTLDLLGADGRVARYKFEKNGVRRTVPGSGETEGDGLLFRVGIRSVALWDEASRNWSDHVAESGAVRMHLDRWQMTASCGGKP